MGRVEKSRWSTANYPLTVVVSGRRRKVRFLIVSALSPLQHVPPAPLAYLQPRRAVPLDIIRCHDEALAAPKERLSCRASRTMAAFVPVCPPRCSAALVGQARACHHPHAVRVFGPRGIVRSRRASLLRRLSRDGRPGSQDGGSSQPTAESSSVRCLLMAHDAPLVKDKVEPKKAELRNVEDKIAALQAADGATVERILQISKRLEAVDVRLHPPRWRLLFPFFFVVDAATRMRLEEEREDLLRLKRATWVIQKRIATDVERFDLQRSRLEAEINDLLRASPLDAALRRLNMVRSSAASLVDISDKVYQPHPVRTFGQVAVEEECVALWERVVREVVSWPEESTTDGNSKQRRPIMYILASPGRGKTLYLREALRFYYSDGASERVSDLNKLAVLCVSFSGYFETTPEDEDTVQSTQEPRIMLYTRIMFAAWAELGGKPDVNFRAFAKAVRDDIQDERTSIGIIREEVETMILQYCEDKHLVLIIDEINKLGPGSGGSALCDALGADARALVRSEACRLASTCGRGSGLFTSLERGIMVAETSSSGRPGHAVGSVQLASPADHVGMMVSVLSAKLPDGGLLAAPQVFTRVYRLGQLFAFLGGGHWRAAELVAGELARGPVPGLLALCEKVHNDLPSTLLLRLGREADGKTGKRAIPLVDLSSAALSDYVDDVFSAVILREEVQRDRAVLPRDQDLLLREAEPEPTGVTELEAAERLYHNRGRTLFAATWDDLARLGIVSATGVYSFVPDIVPATVVALMQRTGMRQTALQMALGELVDIALSCNVLQDGKEPNKTLEVNQGIQADDGSMKHSELDAEQDETAGGPAAAELDQASEAATVAELDEEAETAAYAVADHDKAAEAAADAVATQCNEQAAWRTWELFVASWPRLESVARSLRPKGVAECTLHDLLGRYATHSGGAAVLRAVKVKTSIGKGKVVLLERCQFDGRAVTLQRLISLYPKEELLQTVFLFPTNFQSFDIASFYEAANDVDGVVKNGDMTVLLTQAKHYGIERVSKTGWSVVKKCVKALEHVDAVLGDAEFCAEWRPRMVYAYFSNQELTSSEAPLEGAWEPRTIVLARADTTTLLGNMVSCLSQAIGLPAPVVASNTPSSRRAH